MNAVCSENLPPLAFAGKDTYAATGSLVRLVGVEADEGTPAVELHDLRVGDGGTAAVDRSLGGILGVARVDRDEVAVRDGEPENQVRKGPKRRVIRIRITAQRLESLITAC
mgnify:CR=1 FL=1